MYRLADSVSFNPVPNVANAHCRFEYRDIVLGSDRHAEITMFTVGMPVLAVVPLRDTEPFLNSLTTLLAVRVTK